MLVLLLAVRAHNAHCQISVRTLFTASSLSPILTASTLSPMSRFQLPQVRFFSLLLTPPLTHLSCPVSGLSGPLPPGIASISTLVSLDASRDPGLTGTLPAAWSALSSLSYLNVSRDVGITGPLPGAWSTLTTLVVLDVSHLAVTGALPASWGALTNLQSLSVDSEASVMGSIPPDWSLLVQLTRLSMANDPGLTGGLLSGMSDFSQIKSLAISG